MSFNTLSELRNSRGKFDNLMKEVEKISNPKSNFQKDEREWKPTVDKAGNGYAVIRFLPAPQGEDMPWVRIFNHGFQFLCVSANFRAEEIVSSISTSAVQRSDSNRETVNLSSIINTLRHR